MSGDMESGWSRWIKGENGPRKWLNLDDRSQKQVKLVLGLAALGAVLMLVGNPTSPDPPTSTDAPPPSDRGAVPAVAAQPGPDPIAASMERELAAVLEQIAGAGEVDVSITLERGPERHFAQDRSTERRTTVEQDTSGGQRTISEERVTERPVFARSEAAKGDEPVLLVEVKPTVRGVLIVAEGAGDPEVAYRLMRAAATLLGVSEHRISVTAKRR